MTEDLDYLDPDEEEQTLTPSDLYEQLAAAEELILTIDASDEDKLRKGLASVKNKTNNKLKEADLPIDTRMLNFQHLPCSEPGCVRIHITLANRSGIKIRKMELPDEDM